jgi:hypothetical protein
MRSSQMQAGLAFAAEILGAISSTVTMRPVKVLEEVMRSAPHVPLNRSVKT